MAMRTTLGPGGYPRPPYASFGGKAEGSGAGPHPAGHVTTLSPGGDPRPPYSSFSGKTAADASGHPIELVMRGLNTPEGNESDDILNIMPRYIIAPAALETTVLQLVRSQADPSDHKSSAVVIRSAGVCSSRSSSRSWTSTARRPGTCRPIRGPAAWTRSRSRSRPVRKRQSPTSGSKTGRCRTFTRSFRLSPRRLWTFGDCNVTRASCKAKRGKRARPGAAHGLSGGCLSH